MGAGVSNWHLARAVAMTGQLGVVSGTALDGILARRVQIGDPDGQMRWAMQSFPFPHIAQSVLAEYFIPGGKPAHQPFKLTPLPSLKPGLDYVELTVLANFVEVFLAKEAHSSPIGINYLEKIQLPTLPSLFGAMLAGVDYVLMGAGIPRSIPGILDRLAEGEPVELKIDVADPLAGDEFHTTFNPALFCGGSAPKLKRPLFIGIVASTTLAATLAKKSTGAVNGFIVEGETAGGHNAPPGARCSSVPGANPFMVRGTCRIWKKSANWACRSGWLVLMASRASWRTPCVSAPQASKSVPRLPFVRNPASIPTSSGRPSN